MGGSDDVQGSRRAAVPALAVRGGLRRWLALAPRTRRSKASVWELDGAERMLQRNMAR